MYTREKYMSDVSGEASLNRSFCMQKHHEYYIQFVNQSLIALVSRVIGTDRIKASKDIHFNDIPLKEWDGFVPHINSYLEPGIFKKITGHNSYSISDVVCICKTAARIIKENNQ